MWIKHKEIPKPERCGAWRGWFGMGGHTGVPCPRHQYLDCWAWGSCAPTTPCSPYTVPHRGKTACREREGGKEANKRGVKDGSPWRKGLRKGNRRGDPCRKFLINPEVMDKKSTVCPLPLPPHHPSPNNYYITSRKSIFFFSCINQILISSFFFLSFFFFSSPLNYI